MWVNREPAQAFVAYCQSHIVKAPARVGATDASAGEGLSHPALSNSVATELERISQLYADGILDAEEFRLAKQRVLERE